MLGAFAAISPGVDFMFWAIKNVLLLWFIMYGVSKYSEIRRGK